MLNMDFSRRVVTDTNRMDWVQSPAPGVWRKRLAREEAERGHATSVVRYDPGSRFAEHDHPLGEEILVLSGTFSDHTGDFTAGTYFRNPPGFRHAPFSEQGCVILVKLHQFAAGDTARVCIDTARAAWSDGPDGARVLPMHQFGDEVVALVDLPARSVGPHHDHPGGEEIYVISGEIRDESGVYPAGTWLRQPPGSSHQVAANVHSRLWVKLGHLSHAGA